MKFLSIPFYPIVSDFFFMFQTEARVREVGEREDRDAEALRYGKALCKFLFVSFLSSIESRYLFRFASRARSKPRTTPTTI